MFRDYRFVTAGKDSLGFFAVFLVLLPQLQQVINLCFRRHLSQSWKQPSTSIRLKVKYTEKKGGVGEL